MEPEQIQCEPQADTVLALYTTIGRNAAHQRVPHTRSVYVMRETRDDDQPPALLLLQNLDFVLYAASESEISEAALLHCMQEGYCIKQHSRKAREQATQERGAATAAMDTRVFDEAEWARTGTDAERRALCRRRWDALPEEARQDTDPETIFTSTLQSWHHRLALDAANPVREAGAELFKEYGRLADPVLDRDTMDAPHFFVTRSVRQLAVSSRCW